jgi:hypothetical protein
MALAHMQRPPLSFGRDAASLTLEELLGEARAGFAAEVAIPMTVDQPPALRQRDASGAWRTDAAIGSQVGLSMSPELYRRIGNPQDDYGDVFPVARALDDLRGWCRGRHLEARSGPWEDHRRDVAVPDIQRPLCARLAWYGVAWRMQPVWSAHQEGLPLPTVLRLLRRALEHMWAQRREWAHAGDSGVGEVLAQQRRERREARQRAEASRAAGVTCRFCGGPYDASSLRPCPAPRDANIDAALAEVDVIYLCAPAIDQPGRGGGAAAVDDDGHTSPPATSSSHPAPVQEHDS